MFKNHTEANEVLQKANEVLELATKLLNKSETYELQLKHLVKRFDELGTQKFTIAELAKHFNCSIKNIQEALNVTKAADLKELRLKNRLLQKEVARLIGVCKQTICNWEIGKTQVSEIWFPVLAEVYGCSVDEIKSAIKNTEKER